MLVHPAGVAEGARGIALKVFAPRERGDRAAIGAHGQGLPRAIVGVSAPLADDEEVFRVGRECRAAQGSAITKGDLGHGAALGIGAITIVGFRRSGGHEVELALGAVSVPCECGRGGGHAGAGHTGRRQAGGLGGEGDFGVVAHAFTIVGVHTKVVFSVGGQLVDCYRKVMSIIDGLVEVGIGGFLIMVEIAHRRSVSGGLPSKGGAFRGFFGHLEVARLGGGGGEIGECGLREEGLRSNSTGPAM